MSGAGVRSLAGEPAASWVGPLAERPVRLVLAALPAAALIPIVVSIRYTADFGLAYAAGQKAWLDGNPQQLTTWTGTPFYSAVMAFVSQAVSQETGARIFLFMSVLLWAGLLVVVWDGLSGELPMGWWLASLLAAGVFAPAISTIFWLQPELLVLELALAGFLLAPKRARTGGAIIGLSLALKPILVLLPLVLLISKRYRPAAMWSIGAGAVFSALGLLFLAWRAEDLTRADPVRYLLAFMSKGRGPIVACVPENYSPLALLCRLGLPTPTAVEIGVSLVVVVIALVLSAWIQRHAGPEWGLFATAGLLSPMVGPIGWSIYGVLFGPLLVLLVVEFVRYRAPAFLWVGLALAYLMLELTWDPLESLAGAPVLVLLWSYTIGQFGQYVLLFVWIRWLALRNPLHGAPGSSSPAQSSS